MTISNALTGLDGRAVRAMNNVADARRLAKRRLPGAVFDYVDGGAEDEITMSRNEAAFRLVTFRPRMGTGCVVPRLRTEVLGSELSLPVVLAPCGLVQLLHRDGAAGAARAASERGTVSVLSTVAGIPIETVVAKLEAAPWFQLYAGNDLSEAGPLLERAQRVGVDVLVVTLDTPALGNRERDVRNRVAPRFAIDIHNAARLGRQVLAHPRWASRLGGTVVRLSRQGAGVDGDGGGMLQAVASPFSWDDVARIRERWPGKLVVKGVLTADDACRAVEAGADGVVVSNHGGRQLEGAPASLSVLPEVARVVGQRTVVMMDGGVRRGAHVVAALALGARAVMIGRPYLYGLAAAGEPGVQRVLEIFENELRRTMILLGCASSEELDERWILHPPEE